MNKTIILLVAISSSGCASFMDRCVQSGNNLDYCLEANQINEYEAAQSLRAFAQGFNNAQMPRYEAPAYVPPPTYSQAPVVQYQPSYWQPTHQQPQQQPYRANPVQHYRMRAYEQPTTTIYKTNCGTVGATNASVQCTTIGY